MKVWVVYGWRSRTETGKVEERGFRAGVLFGLRLGVRPGPMSGAAGVGAGAESSGMLARAAQTNMLIAWVPRTPLGAWS